MRILCQAVVQGQDQSLINGQSARFEEICACADQSAQAQTSSSRISLASATIQDARLFCSVSSMQRRILCVWSVLNARYIADQ